MLKNIDKGKVGWNLKTIKIRLSQDLEPDQSLEDKIPFIMS